MGTELRTTIDSDRVRRITTRVSTVASLTMNDQAGEKWGLNGQSAVKVSIQAEVIVMCCCGKKTNSCIQLFRQSLSHESVKAYATMSIGIIGRKSVYQQEKSRHRYVFFVLFPSMSLKHLKPQSKSMNHHSS